MKSQSAEQSVPSPVQQTVFCMHLGERDWFFSWNNCKAQFVLFIIVELGLYLLIYLSSTLPDVTMDVLEALCKRDRRWTTASESSKLVLYETFLELDTQRESPSSLTKEERTSHGLKKTHHSFQMWCHAAKRGKMLVGFDINLLFWGPIFQYGVPTKFVTKRQRQNEGWAKEESVDGHTTPEKGQLKTDFPSSPAPKGTN